MNITNGFVFWGNAVAGITAVIPLSLFIRSAGGKCSAGYA